MQTRCYEPVAFGVLLNHNHGTITRPNQDKQLGDIIKEALSIESKPQYTNHIKNLTNLTEVTFSKGVQDASKEKRYHQYQHVVTRVHDQFDEGIKDYFIEFYQHEGDKKDTEIKCAVFYTS